LLENGYLFYHADLQESLNDDSVKCEISGDEYFQEIVIHFDVNETLNNIDSLPCSQGLNYTYTVLENSVENFYSLDTLVMNSPCIDSIANLDNFQILVSPQHGEISLVNEQQNIIQYIPENGFNGMDVLIGQYSSEDEEEIVLVGITFQVIPEATCTVILNNDEFYIDSDIEEIILEILSNDMRCQDSIASLSIINESVFGSEYYIDDNWLLHYFPASSPLHYTDSLIYELCFENNWCDQASVLINISADMDSVCFIQAVDD